MRDSCGRGLHAAADPSLRDLSSWSREGPSIFVETSRNRESASRVLAWSGDSGGGVRRPLEGSYSPSARMLHGSRPV